jgi:hypothetical protein
MGLFLNILITIIVISILPFGLNYFVLLPNIPFAIIVLFVSVFLLSFILGIWVSYNSGKSKCNHFHWRTCLWKGFKQAFFSTLVYLVIFYIPFFKSGFLGLLGDTFFFSNSLAEAVIMSLTNISLTIDNYFTSITDNCKLDFNVSAEAWKRIEKRLNTRKSKSMSDQVEIKG